MKKRIVSLFLMSLSATSGVQAASSPANLVERPMTLAQGETSLSLGAIYGERQNGDNKWGADIQMGYGITENLTLDFSGLRYRFMARPKNAEGLELNVGVGVRGQLDSSLFGDAHAYGADIAGKYVFNSDMAAFFSVGYIRWNEDRRDNKSEVDYTIGFQSQVVDGLTLSTSYTYRDLSDFAQDDAHVLSAGATYNMRKDIDISLLYSRTTFDYAASGYDADAHYKNGFGLYATYRF